MSVKGRKTEEKKHQTHVCVCQPQYRPLGESPLSAFRATLRTSTLQSPTRWKRAPLITKLVISHKCQIRVLTWNSMEITLHWFPKRKEEWKAVALCDVSYQVWHYNVNNLGLWDYMQWLIKNHKGSCKIIFYGNDVCCLYSRKQQFNHFYVIF